MTNISMTGMEYISKKMISEVIKMFEEFDINFKILSNKYDISVEGYVTINDEDGENVDWHYWNGNGYQSRPFYHHDGEKITGLTGEQNNEIDEFIKNYSDDSLWIDTMIVQSNENENRTFVRENCTLIINEGAKMECEIKEPFDYRGDYVVEVIPKFNGVKVNIAEYIVEMNEEFDPWGVQEPDNSVVENGHIYFEMSKDYWEENKEERMDDVNEEARRIFARKLTSDLGIYAKYGESVEQLVDDTYDDEWLFSLSQLSDDNLNDFLITEGIIDEEEV